MQGMSMQCRNARYVYAVPECEVRCMQYRNARYVVCTATKRRSDFCCKRSSRGCGLVVLVWGKHCLLLVKVMVCCVTLVCQLSDAMLCNTGVSAKWDICCKYYGLIYSYLALFITVYIDTTRWALLEEFRYAIELVVIINELTMVA